MQKMAEFLRTAGVTANEVQHSGKRRAEQTAEILAAAIAGGRLRERSGLQPNDPIEFLVRGYRISLRSSEAQRVQVELLEENPSTQ